MNNKKLMIGILCAFTLFILSCSSNGINRYPTACTEEAKICPDGSAVGRTGPNCEFAPCPASGEGCTKDAKTCPDGTAVGRIGPNCEFAECPTAGIACTPESRTNQGCPAIYSPVCGWFKSTVNCVKYPCAGDYSNRCTACADNMVEYYTYGACPTELNGGTACTQEAKQCSDGSYVGRTGPNCEFTPCPA